MRTDPDPEYSTLFGRGIYADCTIMDSHSDGPDLPNFFEVKRWMLGVGLKKGKALVGNPADVGW